MGDFSGVPNRNYVKLSWEIIWDLDITGFNLLQSTSVETATILLGYIPVDCGNMSHGYIDASVASSENYYWLEVIGADGNSREYLGQFWCRLIMLSGCQFCQHGPK